MIDNIKFLKAAAFTVISFNAHGAEIDQNPITSDVYKVIASVNTPALSAFNETSPVNQTFHVAPFLGNALPTLTTWGIVQQAFTPVNSIQLALDSIGISRAIGSQLLSMAKGILAELNYSEVKVSTSLVRDPEENVSYLTLCLHVNATFEESLALDSKLTKELISRAVNIPENLSFAVYDIG
ncbi:MAG: hypothetical protein ABL903_18930 [Methylococcales bacterium]